MDMIVNERKVHSKREEVEAEERTKVGERNGVELVWTKE